MGITGRARDKLNLDFTCNECGEDFHARRFWTNTDRVDGEEKKYVTAFCEHCNARGEYPWEKKIAGRVINPTLPKPDPKTGRIGRLVKFHRPHDLDEVLEEERRLRKLREQEEE